MKRLIALSVLVACVPAAFAFPLTAYFTGNQENITTVSGAYGIKCEYRVSTMQGDRYFWETFANQFSCPYSVQVE